MFQHSLGFHSLKESMLSPTLVQKKEQIVSLRFDSCDNFHLRPEILAHFTQLEMLHINRSQGMDIAESNLNPEVTWSKLKKLKLVMAKIQGGYKLKPSMLPQNVIYLVCLDSALKELLKAMPILQEIHLAVAGNQGWNCLMFRSLIKGGYLNHLEKVQLLPPEVKCYCQDVDEKQHCIKIFGIK